MPAPRHAPRTGFLGGIGLAALVLAAAAVGGAGLFLQSCAESSIAHTRGRAAALADVQFTSVPSGAMERRNDHQAVHVTGPLRLREPLADPELGITAEALALERQVEVFEEGPPPAWHAQPMAPEQDAEEGSERRGTLVSARFEASGLRLGAFDLRNVEVPEEMARASQPLPLSPAVLRRLPEGLRSRARIAGEWIHFGDSPAPAGGDLRVRYRIAPVPVEVSAIAGQDYWGLSPHALSNGQMLFAMKPGRHAARDLVPARPATDAGIFPAHAITIPLFVVAACLAYPPLRVSGRRLAALRPLTDAGLPVFVALASMAAWTGGVAYWRWARGAPAVAAPAAFSVAAALLLVVAGVKRRERLAASPAGEAAWYYAADGGAVGPIPLGELAQAVPGRLPIDTLVFSPWTRGWVPASEVPALAARQYWSERQAAEGPGPVAWYFFGPFLLVAEGLRLIRDLRSDRRLSRADYLWATVLAIIVALFFVYIAAGFPGLEGRIALAVAFLGFALGGAVLVAATACRLRDLGESPRRSLWILVPGLNFLLWFHLVDKAGASERRDEPPAPGEPVKQPPLMPPPDH